MDQLHQQAKIFLTHADLHGVYVSIITFSDDATVRKNLTLLDDSSVASLVAELPTTDDIQDKTCMGCGLLKAVEVSCSWKVTANYHLKSQMTNLYS